MSEISTARVKTHAVPDDDDNVAVELTLRVPRSSHVKKVVFSIEYPKDEFNDVHRRAMERVAESVGKHLVLYFCADKIANSVNRALEFEDSCTTAFLSRCLANVRRLEDTQPSAENSQYATARSSVK